MTFKTKTLFPSYVFTQSRKNQVDPYKTLSNLKFLRHYYEVSLEHFRLNPTPNKYHLYKPHGRFRDRLETLRSGSGGLPSSSIQIRQYRYGGLR